MSFLPCVGARVLPRGSAQQGSGFPCGTRPSSRVGAAGIRFSLRCTSFLEGRCSRDQQHVLPRGSAQQGSGFPCGTRSSLRVGAAGTSSGCWDLPNPASPPSYHAYCFAVCALAHHPLYLFPWTIISFILLFLSHIIVHPLYSKQTDNYLLGSTYSI
jgi:hypothetical protein